ncbi:amino acid ABC transporter permease [Mobilicoccus caccae]|uniref:Glutamate ABC transporter permease n=1 Tax=Mobilicoccus caccae TaxID=1859295 RepID=A0ABQ6IU07_9MICO|nr:amino acid ABC transporter permease [Mobilicoccus caccae]GMA40158.1 glutamate ABC transporter permease [Mobilicoccus caccae]
MSAGVAQLFDVPGPRGRMLQRVAAGVLIVIALGLGAAVLWKLAERGNLAPAKWSPFLTSDVWQFYIVPGLINTLYAAAISIALASVLGLLLALGRLSPIAPVRWVASVFVEFFRAVPVLVMMLLSFWGYLAFAGLPSAYLPLAGVVTGLTLYNSCVLAELLRSGVLSLPKGQAEAGLSIGLTQGQTLMAVQLPQALRAMLPALVGQLVVILKDTALGYQILYAELLRQAERIGSAYFNIVPALIVIALIYIAINFALTSFATWLEHRLTTHGHVAGGVQGADPTVGMDDPYRSSVTTARR